MSPEESRLLRRLFRNTSFNSNGCFEWTGHHDKDGYGWISIDGDSRRVPRVALWLLGDMELRGSDPVLHRCDNPPCWNPDHIYVGTLSENTRDAIKRGRLQPLQGSKCSQSKINEDIALEIKCRLRTGEPQVQIARDMGLRKALVNDIATGKTWAHVQLPHSPQANYCDGCGAELFTSYKSSRRKADCRYCYIQSMSAA